MSYVEVHDQIKLPYVEQGDAAGVPMLLLHGFAGSWRVFKPMLAHLPDSIHAFALTQRGHGEASKPEQGYRLHDLAADVAAFMDAVDLEAAVIVGHSMGSAVARHFALDHPGRTLGLVLVGACVTRPGEPAFVHETGKDTYAQPIPRDVFKMLLEDSQKVPSWVWTAAGAGYLEEDLSGELGQIEAPTLIVWGDRDTRCPRSDQETLVEGIVDAQLVVYRGAGHGLHVEEPERFASDLAAFVRDRISRAG